MINIYKYIFYRTYKWQLKIYGDKDIPEFKALFAVSIIVLCNIFTIGLSLQMLGLVRVTGLSKTTIILVSIAVAIVLYLLFVRREKYKTIVWEFKDENLKRRFINSSIMYIFIAISVAINIVIATKYL